MPRGVPPTQAEVWPTQAWQQAHDLLLMQLHSSSWMRHDLQLTGNHSGCWIIWGWLTKALSSLLPADALSDVSAAL